MITHLSISYGLTFIKYKHDPKGKAARMNGQITEVKQPRPRIILRWMTVWHPQFSFRLVEILGNLCKPEFQKLLIQSFPVHGCKVFDFCQKDE